MSRTPTEAREVASRLIREEARRNGREMTERQSDKIAIDAFRRLNHDRNK